MFAFCFTSQMNFFLSAQLSVAKNVFSVEFFNWRKTQSPFAEGSPFFHLVPVASNLFPLALHMNSEPSLAPDVQKSPTKSR